MFYLSSGNIRKTSRKINYASKENGRETGLQVQGA